jgi:hypothetical protein
MPHEQPGGDETIGSTHLLFTGQKQAGAMGFQGADSVLMPRGVRKASLYAPKALLVWARRGEVRSDRTIAQGVVCSATPWL